MACVLAASKGAGSYTLREFINYDSGAATAALVMATILLPATLTLTKTHMSKLNKVPPGSPGGELVRQWYRTLGYFPAVAAVSCWLSIVLPNLGIAFTVVFVAYEAVCLTRFSFVILTLASGGVVAIDRHLEGRSDTVEAGGFKENKQASIAGALYYPMMHSSAFQKDSVPSGYDASDFDSSPDGDGVNQGLHRKRVGRLFLALYQFIIFAPLLEFLEAICTYAEAEAAGSVFRLFFLMSTAAVMITLVCTLCAVHNDLPSETRLEMKFLSIKGMVVLGTIQGIVIGIGVQCTSAKARTVFPPEVAASMWQSLIFLTQLPFLQLAVNHAYPASDLARLFGFPESPTGRGISRGAFEPLVE